MNDYKVYMHTTPNNKKYIGITRNTINTRWQNGNGYHTQIFFNAIQKYGWDNIKHEVLFENLTKEEAEQKEIELISLYKSNQSEYGYNIANGGNAKGRVSQHTREIMSKKYKGVNNPFFAKKHSDKTREILSQKSRLRKHTDEEKKKIGEANKRRIISQQTREKISKFKLSDKNTWRGKHLSDIAKQKISQKNSKKIICIEINKIYNSITEASKELKCSLSGIAMACRGKRTTAQGYHWNFID